MQRDIRFAATCSSGGAYSGTDTVPVNGRLIAVELVLGTLASGAADVTVSVTRTPSGVDSTLLTLTDVAANALYYPRHQVHGNTGTALTLDGTRIMATWPLVCGLVKCVVAQGGNAGAGTVIVYVEE